MQEKSTAFGKKNCVPEESYIFLGFLIAEVIRKISLYCFQTDVLGGQFRVFSGLQPPNLDYCTRVCAAS